VLFVVQMALPTLYQTSSSPWSERARWALDHHGIAYQQIEHMIMLGEPLLRLRLGRLRGQLTMPLYVDPERQLTLLDSVEIARHADAIGGAAKLFPAGLERDVDAWVRRSTDLLEAGRSLLLPRLLQDRAARREAFPPQIPAPLRGVLDPLARMGTRFLRRKYRGFEHDATSAERTIRATLEAARARLAGGASTLLDAGFSFADVAFAAALQMVRPVEHPAMNLGTATRGAWTHGPIAGEFADVLAWRDRVYLEHRPARVRG
jgi:glutathione S-transferase